MLQFWLERGDDETKRWQKMKRRQRTHLGSIVRKRDTAWQRDNVARRRGDTEVGKERRQCQLD
jgi:hypothetical protein